MKNNIKKWWALMLAVLMLITVAGCGSKKTEGDNTGGGQDKSDNEEQLNVSQEFLDSLKGMTMTIAYPDKMRNPGENPIDDEWAMNVNKIANKFGLTINEEYYTNKQNGAVFITDSLAGNNLGNVEMVYMSNVFYGVQSGAWANLDEAAKEAGVDFTAKQYFVPNMKASHINGANYGLSYKGTNVQFEAVYYNVNMITVDNKLEDPYELYKKGEWTFDKFEEYCKKLTKTDANGEISVYGCQLEANASINLFIEANGGSIGYVNSDGKWKQALADKKTITGLNYISKWLGSDRCIYVPSGSWGTNHLNLYSGKTAMAIGNADTAFRAYLQQTDEGGMGVVPLPKGPDSTDDSAFQSFGGFYYVIPAAYQKDAAKYLFIMDQIGKSWYENYPEIFRKQCTAIFKQDKYYDLFYSLNSAEALTDLNQGRLCLTKDASGYSPTWLALTVADGTSPATAVDKFSTALQNEHDDLAGTTRYTGFN